MFRCGEIDAGFALIGARERVAVGPFRIWKRRVWEDECLFSLRSASPTTLSS